MAAHFCDRVRFSADGQEAIDMRDDASMKWATRIAVPVTCIVCLFAFWRLSPGVTWILALAALAGLVAALWIAGKE